MNPAARTGPGEQSSADNLDVEWLADSGAPQNSSVITLYYISYLRNLYISYTSLVNFWIFLIILGSLHERMLDVS